jgi:mevalonate kinase
MTAIGLGKIILLGEHAVVYGYPALAAALDRGVRVSAVPTPKGGPLRVDVPAWNLKVGADGDEPLARGLAAIADALDIGRPPLTLVGDAQIPPGAGLGASAAFAVAVARELASWRDTVAPARSIASAGGAGWKKLERADIAAAANASEAILHGNPSGVDAAIAMNGGVGVFRKRGGLAAVVAPPARVLVGPSGSPRSTAAMIERVHAATRGQADDARLRELAALTDGGTVSLVAGDAAALGRAMDRAHAILGELGVSTPFLDGLCGAARAAGAHGAKLTGAGGGGAVIALAPKDREADVLAAWKAVGVDGFVAKIGART